MFKKLFILNLIIIFISLNTVRSIEADIFVQSTVNRASDTLSGNKTKEERIEELKKIALDTVDIKGIGFYSLGKHRKNLSNDKKIELSASDGSISGYEDIHVIDASILKNLPSGPITSIVMANAVNISDKIL